MENESFSLCLVLFFFFFEILMKQMGLSTSKWFLDWLISIFFQNRCISCHLLWASRAVPPTLCYKAVALSHCEMSWQDKLHEHTEQRPKSLRDKLQEPLPKVKLNSLFRMLMLKWQAHHFVWTIQWCQDTQLVSPHSEFDANFNCT